MSPGISIVIPTWNGIHLLREHLPSVLRAAEFYSQRSGAPTEVLLVDDGSQDETATVVPECFPSVILISRPHNSGFAPACNTGFAHCRFPVVSLLNNDVSVEEDYFLFKAHHFPDENLFAVTAKVFEDDPPIFATGGKYGRFRRGFWSCYFNYDVNRSRGSEWIENSRLLSFYAVGGFATFDRIKLSRLGGFNELLSPFHWEDVDLSYRGWKRGWETRYEPRSVAHHQVSATINARYKKSEVSVVAVRNRMLFHWVNLHSASFLVGHLLMLLLLLLTRFFVLDHWFYRSFFGALRRLPAVIRARRKERKEARVSDREIARSLSKFYRAAPLRIYWGREDVIAHHFESPRQIEHSPTSGLTGHPSQQSGRES